MNRLDRVMGILLLLRGGRAVPARELAERFEVTARTIYRDIELLSGLGVPVEAEMGSRGGFRLREGYFLPPVTLDPEEAVSLLLGLLLARRLRIAPFPQAAEFAERKLLAALPEETRLLAARAAGLIGFESTPPDLLHPERDDPITAPARSPEEEALVVGRFLRAALSRSRARLRYRSPYRAEEESLEVEPLGVVWDRDRWYLVGDAEVRPGEPRMWRSDRVLEIGPAPSMRPTSGGFEAGDLLGRKWLGLAMERWRAEHPVRMALGPAQAALLKADWYYGHALFEPLADGRTVMTWGEAEPEPVLALARWLGPGAELLEPEAWRPRLAAELESLAAAYRR